MTLHQQRTHPEPVEGCFGCKAASIQWGSIDVAGERRHVRRLDLYKSARKQGIQPASTKLSDIRKALDISDRTGSAFKAG